MATQSASSDLQREGGLAFAPQERETKNLRKAVESETNALFRHDLEQRRHVDLERLGGRERRLERARLGKQRHDTLAVQVCRNRIVNNRRQKEVKEKRNSLVRSSSGKSTASCNRESATVYSRRMSSKSTTSTALHPGWKFGSGMWYVSLRLFGPCTNPKQRQRPFFEKRTKMDEPARPSQRLQGLRPRHAVCQRETKRSQRRGSSGTASSRSRGTAGPASGARRSVSLAGT